MKTTDSIIAQLETRIAEDCTPIDREARFDNMLDECYSFDKVGGPFANMSPSRVLREVDPTAYRCGVNDFADGEEWVEIDGETYDKDEAEKVREAMVSDLESEISDLESEIEDLEAEDADRENDEEETNAARILGLDTHLSTLRATLNILERHSL